MIEEIGWVLFILVLVGGIGLAVGCVCWMKFAVEIVATPWEGESMGRRSDGWMDDLHSHDRG